jgi:hypothetical protein
MILRYAGDVYELIDLEASGHRNNDRSSRATDIGKQAVPLNP